MNPEAYLEMATAESFHWYFIGRRSIIKTLLLETISKNTRIKILEIGCGTGGNLDLLNNFGEVKATECNDEARTIAINKTNSRYKIKYGLLPNMLPYEGEKFDLICLFDVLEHIEEDCNSLIEINKLLEDDGRIILTVPAYQFLFSEHDKYLHHKRRYSKKALLTLAKKTNLIPVKISHFNFFLFPLAFLMRFFDNFFDTNFSSQSSKSIPIYNKIFSMIFKYESFILKFINFPFGLSLYIILKKTK